MPTVRLHYDPAVLAFSATVVGHGAVGASPAAILDRTAFYPESGGQMADHGLLDGAPVTDVQVDRDGLVHHVVAGPLPAAGTVVQGRIDAERRRLHMAEHTGQHMLSAALLRVAAARTISARLGGTECTIDLAARELGRDQLRRAEELVNRTVDEDVEVRAFFPSAEELASLALRRPPKVAEDVRVVAVGELDMVPCGGTHCVRSGQVGLVLILGAERKKGGIRVIFAAGRRARELACTHVALLDELCRELTCGPGDVSRAVAALGRELESTRAAERMARDRRAVELARALLGSAPGPLVSAELEEGDLELLRAVGKHIVAAPGRVAALASPTPDGLRIFVARSAGSSFDCGALCRAAVASAGGRGGGRPDHAEGLLPAGAAWLSLVAAHAGCGKP